MQAGRDVGRRQAGRHPLRHGSSRDIRQVGRQPGSTKAFREVGMQGGRQASMQTGGQDVIQ